MSRDHDASTPARVLEHVVVATVTADPTFALQTSNHLVPPGFQQGPDTDRMPLFYAHIYAHIATSVDIPTRNIVHSSDISIYRATLATRRIFIT